MRGMSLTSNTAPKMQVGQWLTRKENSVCKFSVMFEGVVSFSFF